METSQRNASYEVVYNTLKERILHLELIPGTLVSETDTASEFSVSRTPVRDAFKALVNDGLLEVKPHIGTFVTRIDMNEISDILYIREIMEKSIATDLAASFNQSQEFKLKVILKNQENLIENSSLTAKELASEFLKSDNEFHRTLFALAGRKNLTRYFSSINGQYMRFRTFLNYEDKSTVKKLYQQHVTLLDQIKEKNTDGISDTITHHIYDGFNSKANILYEYPDYFKSME